MLSPLPPVDPQLVLDATILIYGLDVPVIRYCVTNVSVVCTPVAVVLLSTFLTSGVETVIAIVAGDVNAT